MKIVRLGLIFHVLEDVIIYAVVVMIKICLSLKLHNRDDMLIILFRWRIYL
jgi:hypothetical protein